MKPFTRSGQWMTAATLIGSKILTFQQGHKVAKRRLLQCMAGYNVYRMRMIRLNRKEPLP